MTEKQVKKLIGKENWKNFIHWMRGQTCGMNKDGNVDYYECDVIAFKEKLDNGYDRQNDKYAWD